MSSDNDEELKEPTHPRFRERRAEIEDESSRSRQRKLIALAVLVVVVLLGIASTQSPLFDVDEVRIVGAARTSPETLREATGVELGTPILGLDTNAIEERLQALPQIESVVATSSWRGVVTVEVNERLPVARIESATGTVIIAADGIVIEVISPVVISPVVVEPDGETPDGETPDGETPDGETPDGETPDGETPDGEPVTVQAPLPPDLQALPELAGAMFVTEQGEQIPDVLNDALMVATALPDDIAAITERVEITVDSLVLRVVGGGRVSLGDARNLALKFDAVRAFLAQVDLSCLDTLNVRAPSVPVIRRNTGC